MEKIKKEMPGRPHLPGESLPNNTVKKETHKKTLWHARLSGPGCSLSLNAVGVSLLSLEGDYQEKIKRRNSRTLDDKQSWVSYHPVWLFDLFAFSGGAKLPLTFITDPLQYANSHGGIYIMCCSSETEGRSNVRAEFYSQRFFFFFTSASICAPPPSQSQDILIECVLYLTGLPRLRYCANRIRW